MVRVRTADPWEVPRRLPRALLYGTWCALGAYAVALVVPWLRGDHRFWFARDVVLFGVVVLGAAAAASAQALTPPRLLNRFLVAAAILSFGIGSIDDALVADRGGVVDFPSVSDGFYLAFYVLLLVVLYRVIRTRRARRVGGLWLDTAIVVLGCASVALALTTTLVPAGGSWSTGVVTMVFAALDAALLLLLLGAHLVDRVPLDRMSVWVIVSVGALAVGDLAYAYWNSTGEYREGGPVDLTWTFALVGLATASFGRAETSARIDVGANRLGLPGVAAGLAALVLVGNQIRPGSDAAVWVALATVMLMVVRAFRSNAALRSLWSAQREARSDPLTELPNHRALSERIDTAVDDGEPFICVLVQVDGVREVNDAFGHVAGDEVLVAVSGLLSSIRTEPPYRVADHRFCFVIDASTTAAEQLASDVHERLGRPVVLDGTEVALGVSIGAAVWPEDTADPVELLAFADAAMRDARRSGRPLVVHCARPEVRGTVRFDVLGELRARIEREEIELQYQPQVRVEDAGLVGVEALARCTSDDLGVVGPDVFIPVVESAGLMPAFTRLAVRRGIDDALGWRRHGLDLELSVNVALSCLHDDEFVAALLDELATRAPDLAAPLTIELTEEAMGRGLDEVLPVLERLHDAGCRLAIDDFGKGHSSIGRLHQLPVDTLKLDKELLEVDPHERRSLDFFRALEGLGGALGMTTLAEGVESAAQLDLLRRAGIQKAQGYLVAGAMTADALVVWAADYRRAIDELAVDRSG